MLSFIGVVFLHSNPTVTKIRESPVQRIKYSPNGGRYNLSVVHWIQDTGTQAKKIIVMFLI